MRRTIVQGALAKATAAVIAVTLVVAGTSVAIAAPPTNLERARLAAGYLGTRQENNGSVVAFSAIGSTADAVLAWVAAGRGKVNIRRALRYLARQVARDNVADIGQNAKILMAVAAAGRDPGGFGGANLVRRIRSQERPNGRFRGAEVFDQALVLLALEAASRPASGAAERWLARAQCGDGGWAFDEPSRPSDDRHCQDVSNPANDFVLSDTNTTALAVMALSSSRGGPEPAADPFAFFDRIRDDARGGWGSTWGFETTDANSTALVIQAHAALGRSLPAGAMAALTDLHDKSCGAWSFTWASGVPTGADVGATIGGVLGVMREPLPLRAEDVTRPVPEIGACGA